MNPEEYCKSLKACLGIEAIFKVTKPPGYVSNLMFNNQEDLIILVYREEKPVEKSLLHKINVADISEIGDSIADLSITGQPLECPFEQEDDILDVTVSLEPVIVPEDHYHVPLSLQEARKCLSIVNLKMIPPLPVWILTDLSDRNKTFLLASEIKSNWRTRFWAMAHSNQTEKIPINDMNGNFEKMFPHVRSGYKITSSVSCVFNIKDQPGMAKNSKCFLEAKWQRASYEVPISQADTSLIIECNVGQEESQISRWWQQLTLLHEYLEIIKQRKQAVAQFTYQRDSIELPSFKSEVSSSQPLSARVLDLLQSSDSMSVCRQLASHHNTTSALNSTIHELLADKQKGQDFTDRLWNLLIEAGTYKELAECFQLVIREVRKQSVKPYIFAKNKTRLASLLRSIKASSSSVELMLEPLELVVEMGLEKLKRDYMFMFLASHIASEESLALPKLPSFSSVVSSEWQATVETGLCWLAQLHTVLELVSVIHTSMNTPTLVQVTALALSSYVCPDSPVPSLLHLINNRTYKLRAPVLSAEVRSFIEGDKSFYKWMLKICASTDTNIITSTYVLLEQSPYPQKILLLLEEDESLNNTELLTKTVLEASITSSTSIQEKYSYIQLCSISDKLPSHQINVD